MMKTNLIHSFIAVACSIAMTYSAQAQVTISQVAVPTTYSTTLTFDEAGGPTGQVATDAFASFGISSLDSGDGAVRTVEEI